MLWVLFWGSCWSDKCPKWTLIASVLAFAETDVFCIFGLRLAFFPHVRTDFLLTEGEMMKLKLLVVAAGLVTLPVIAGAQTPTDTTMKKDTMMMK